MKNEFKQFIKSFERDDNKSLIESILEGFSICFETDMSKNYNKFPLSALVKQARKFDNFKDFGRFYSIEIYHGYYWHLTDNPNFKISKETGPRDMSSMASGNISEKGAMMITSHLENWDAYYNDEKVTRPYAVLIDASDVDPKDLKQVSRGFGNEVYVDATNAEKLKIIGVYDIKYAKRLEKKFDNIIPGSEEELEELWKFANNKTAINESEEDSNEYWWNELSPEEQDKYLLQKKLKKIPKKKFRKYVSRDKKLWEEAKQRYGHGGDYNWAAVQKIYNDLYFAKYGHEPKAIVEEHMNVFYDFLNMLKTDVNIFLLESIEKGYSVLFETQTVAQTLIGREKKNPFFIHEHRYIKKLVRELIATGEYHFRESGDTRNPYEFLDRNEKFLDVFVNWVTLQVLNNKEELDEEGSEEIEKIAEKIRYIDPKQIDMFGYSQEDLKTIYLSQSQKASLIFLEENKEKYVAAVKHVLYDYPADSISNPEESGRHGGDMAGWSSDEYEEYSEAKYGGDYPFEEEAVSAWSAYLDKAMSDPKIFKLFQDPKYVDNMATSDAESLNTSNYEKTVAKISKRINRTDYEEAEPIIEMPGDFVWVDSTKKSCSQEAKQMGHCGNEHGPDIEPHDTLWSLRHGKKPSEWESHMTLVINGNDIIKGKNLIKQFVGHGPDTGNSKPTEEYHPYIMKLLTSKDPRTGNWIVDGIYSKEYHAGRSGKSFEISDLSEENQELLKNIRPELFGSVERMVARR